MTNIKRTKPTGDHDAQIINALLNDVERMCSIGGALFKLLDERFDMNHREFKNWCRCHLDRDLLTLTRYMLLCRNIGELRRNGLVKLRDAYRYLTIDGTRVEIEGAA